MNVMRYTATRAAFKVLIGAVSVMVLIVLLVSNALIAKVDKKYAMSDTEILMRVPDDIQINNRTQFDIQNARNMSKLAWQTYDKRQQFFLQKQPLIILAPHPHPRDAGLGDHLQFFLHSVVMAEKHNLLWMQSAPLLSNRGNDWESFFRLSVDEFSVSQLPLLFPTKRFEEHIVEGKYFDAIKTELEIVRLRDHCIARNSDCLIYLLHSKIPCHAVEEACLPTSNLQFRRKYCDARLLNPVSPDMFPQSTSSDSVLVVLHYRGGDILGCLPELRYLPITDAITALKLTHDALLSHGFHSHFVIYSQAPDGYNAREVSDFFQPFYDTGFNISLQLDISAAASFHAMVTAPVFIGSASGFSTVATLLRHGPTISVRGSCSNYVQLHPGGYFNTAKFLQYFDEYYRLYPVNRLTGYENEADCTSLQPRIHPKPELFNTSYFALGLEDDCQCWSEGFRCNASFVPVSAC